MRKLSLLTTLLLTSSMVYAGWITKGFEYKGDCLEMMCDCVEDSETREGYCCPNGTAFNGKGDAHIEYTPCKCLEANTYYNTTSQKCLSKPTCNPCQKLNVATGTCVADTTKNNQQVQDACHKCSNGQVVLKDATKTTVCGQQCCGTGEACMNGYCQSCNADQIFSAGKCICQTNMQWEPGSYCSNPSKCCPSGMSCIPSGICCPLSLPNQQGEQCSNSCGGCGNGLKCQNGRCEADCKSQVIFESSKAGEYSVKIPQAGYYEIIMAGAGGNFKTGYYAGGYSKSCSLAGGAGAGFLGYRWLNKGAFKVNVAKKGESTAGYYAKGCTWGFDTYCCSGTDGRVERSSLGMINCYSGSGGVFWGKREGGDIIAESGDSGSSSQVIDGLFGGRLKDYTDSPLHKIGLDYGDGGGTKSTSIGKPGYLKIRYVGSSELCIK